MKNETQKHHETRSYIHTYIHTYIHNLPLIALAFLMLVLVPAKGWAQTEEQETDTPRGTTASKPTVTVSVSNIGYTSVTASGSITADGGASITAKGFVWSTKSGVTTSNYSASGYTSDGSTMGWTGGTSSSGSGTSDFSKSITGLAPNTTYYVRAYATNSAGTTYTQTSFSTTSASTYGGSSNLTYHSTNGGTGTQGADKMFDNNTSTKWYKGGMGSSTYYWTIFYAADAIRPVGYQMATGGDTYTYPDRNPKTWRISGASSESGPWTVIETESNNYYMGKVNTQYYSFGLEGNAAYQYYKLEVLGSTQGSDAVQISEFRFLVVYHTVSKNTPSNGTLSVNKTSAIEGQTVTITTSANTGYQLTGTPTVTKSGGGSVTVTSIGSGQYTFIMPDDDVTVNATYAPISCSVSVSANPSAGGTVSGGGSFNYGATANLAATPNAGYIFTNWTEGGSVVSTNASYSFTVTGNRTLVANFTPTYDISVSANPSAGGTVSGGGTYASGTSHTVSATANPGYLFANWTESGSVVSTNANYEFTVSGHRTLVANFGVGCTVTTNVSPASSGMVSGGGTYASGASCTLTANSNSGYAFSRWSDGNTSNPRTITVTGDATYTAEFTAYPDAIMGYGHFGSSDWSVWVPTYPSENYALSQQIYTASEIGATGTITALKFYSKGFTGSRTLDVYLQTTDKTTFSSTTEWAHPSTGDRVFSGSVTFTAELWTTITLTTPFQYDGTSNIILTVDDNTSSAHSPSGDEYNNFYAYSGTDNKDLRIKSTTDLNPATITSTGTLSKWRSVCKLTLLPTVATTGVSTYTTTTATLGGNLSTPGGSALTGRGVVYSNTETTPTLGGSGCTTVAISGSATGAFSQEVTGLTSSTTYYVRAYATNAGGTSYGDVVRFSTNMVADDITVTGTTTIDCGSTTTLTASGLDGVSYNWYSDAACTELVQENSPTLTTPILNGTVTYYVKAVKEIKEEHTFSYTGSVQTYTVPSGFSNVKMEVWGAEGGGRRVSGISANGLGGLGGYSVGTMPVSGGETLNVYVGGIGGYSSSGLAYGGYNGGGTTYASSTDEPAGGGGGATDIRLNGTTLYDRIIVAGGGGGGGEDPGDTGGYGGGTSGGAGNGGSYQGTQTSSSGGAVFGSGASSPNDGGAGGGGWYGGGTSAGSQTIPSSNSTSDCSGGSGGSGYVWTSATASSAPSGYNVPASYYLTDAQTIAGNAEMPNPSGGTMTGREGNGYARIIPYTIYESEAKAVTVTVNQLDAADITVTGTTTIDCGGSTTLTASGIAGASYNWYSDAECTVLVQENSASLPIIGLIDNTTYYVKAVKGMICETEAVAVPVTVNALDVNDITVTGTTTLNCGNTTTLTASGIDGVSYNWYSNAECTVLVQENSPTLTTPALGDNTTYYVKAVRVITEEHTFSYTGSVQTYTVPAGFSDMKMEVWGAQGGTYSSNTGGLGGYSVGTLTNLSGVNTLNVYVGGAGTTSTAAGYNGGGAGVSNGRGGGGATDIRLNGTSLYDRIIVAGGGGGAGVASGSAKPAGCGGGEYGGDGYYNYTNGTYVIGNNRSGGGATPTQGGISWNSQASTQGTFGQGGNAYNYSCGGGGGGWYGGGGAYDSDSDADGRYGGGGSGYVWTAASSGNAPSGYKVSSAYYLTDAQTIAGNTLFPAPGGGTETGHTGNGYARITFYAECETEPKAITITVNQLDADDITVTGTTTIDCGSSTTLTASGIDDVSYNWYSDAECTELVQENNATLTTPALSDNTTYYVKAVNGMICETEAVAVSVIVNALDADDITVTGTTITCGSSTTLTASGIDGVSYNWYSDAECTELVQANSATLTTPALSDNTTYYVKAVRGIGSLEEGDVIPFSYTGSEQSYTIPANVGAVKMEVWGAQGGTVSGKTEGGRGGYSVGTMNVTAGMTLNVYVGGQGSSGTNVAGGFNGGGLGYSSNNRTMASGGGATDIRVNGSTLYSRVIVAGGGGGGYETGSSGNGSTAAYGGGLTGGTGTGSSAGRCGQGATQTSGGAAATTNTWGGTLYAGGFGVGGYSSGAGYSNGGGGGWYGGGASSPDGGAGGGSGYVYTSSTASNYPSGCLLTSSHYLTDAQTIAGSTTMPNPSGSGTITGRTGNGYARITLYQYADFCESEATAVTVTVNQLDADDIAVTTTINCDNSATLTASGIDGVSYNWYSDAACNTLVQANSPTLTTSVLDESTTYYVKAVREHPATEEELTFSYTGSEQSCTIPAGVEAVKMEVWGAQGGGSSTYPGSKGGYSTGVLNVSSGQTLYVYVGGKGNTTTGSGWSLAEGGWNGGGAARMYNYAGGGGGGATDICTVRSDMTLDGTNRYVRTSTSYLSRIIVAGGGGGSNGGESAYSVATVGGGLNGGGVSSNSSGLVRERVNNSTQGGCGTQTTAGNAELYSTDLTYYNSNTTTSSAPGAFGMGGTYYSTVSGNTHAGGGGGGWYGGGVNCHGSGGGGSGYVYTSSTASNYPVGCQLNSSYYLTDASTIAGDQSMPNPSGGTMTGREGDGYARITFYYAAINCESEAKAITVAPENITVSGTTTIECGSTTTLTASGISDATYNWYSDAECTTPVQENSATFTTPTLEETTTYYVRAAKENAGGVTEEELTFSYTGAVQSYTIPTGVSRVKLEVWGAQGGEGAYDYLSADGGKGGFSEGMMAVAEGDVLNVYVGGAGAHGLTTTGSPVTGGFNGGGNSGANGTSNNNKGGASGGGATDVRVNSTSLYARVIVAGGGGGGGNSWQNSAATGGYGGGTAGGNGSSGGTAGAQPNSNTWGSPGGGGTQTSGGLAGTYSSSYPGNVGTFGLGANGYTSQSKSAGGGGGGGWYGGGSGSQGSSAGSGGGGGGSGYVYTSSTASNYPSGCLLNSSYYLDDAQTIAGNATMPNPGGGTMTGREGNGYARITLYYDKCETAAEAVTVTVATLSTYTVTANVMPAAAAAAGCTVSVTNGGSIVEGAPCTLTANAGSSGYTFKTMTNNGTGSTVAATPTMSHTVASVTGDMSFTAYFDLQAAPGEGGASSWATAVDESSDVPSGGYTTDGSDNVTISNKQALAWLVSVVNGLNGEDGDNLSGKTVTLTADVDMSGNEWVPIGTAEHPFSGTFDGGGHNITGLTRTTDIPHMGLFGYVDGGSIGHVVAEVSFSGNSLTAGALAGTFSGNGLMSNVEGAGTLEGGSSTIAMGGLAGATSGEGAIHSSFAVAALNGSAMRKGGLVGDNAVNLYNCYSNGTMSGTATDKGGLVGVNASGKSIENCYAAGIATGMKAFAGTNNGTISYCYTDDEGDGMAGGVAPTKCGTYAAPESSSKHLDYMYRDNTVTASGNEYVSATGYANGHTPKWSGLVSVLNQWVADGHSAEGIASWHRPLTTDINGDLPVLGFGSANSLATLDSDTRCLHYGSTSGGNGIDALLTAYNDNNSGDPEPDASIFLYGDATGVSQVPTGNVKVYVQEDAALLQGTGSKTAGDFINTTVGITFDNSDRGTTAQDYQGNALAYDWHFMSTPLRNAAIGATYNTTTAKPYTASSGANIENMVNGYFPNGLMSGDVKWDLYTYYEPAYHWINFKRSRDNHWYNDGNARIEYSEADQLYDDTTGNFIPGKGYMMAISQNTFMNQTGTLNKGKVSIALTYGEPEGVNYAKGANLVGNPYQGYLDLSKITDKYDGSDGNLLDKFYIYDADQGVYAPVVDGSSANPVIPSKYIHPHQGFFVLAPKAMTLEFEPGWAGTTRGGDDGSHYRDEEEPRYPLVNLFAENESGQRDLAVIEFHRPEVGGAEKLDAMRSAPFRLSAYHERKDYGILFTTDEMARVPVHFKTGEDGPMTLRWSTHNGEFGSLRLVDNITGVNYDMLAHDSYTFNASVEDYSARFYITYDCSGTGIEENDNDGTSTGTATATFAYINNGNIVIDGVETCHGASLQVIDVTGRVLVCRDALNASPISTAGMAPGVYLLRLAGSKQVRVQKIVVQ